MIPQWGLGCYLVQWVSTWDLLLTVSLTSPVPLLWKSFVLVSLSEMPGDFSYQPPLRPAEGFEVPREQLRSNFKTLSRSSFELSSNPLPQMCGPEGNSEFLMNSQALPEKNKKTETSRQKAAMGTTQPGRENQESWDICNFPYLLNFLRIFLSSCFIENSSFVVFLSDFILFVPFSLSASLPSHIHSSTPSLIPFLLSSSLIITLPLFSLMNRYCLLGK